MTFKASHYQVALLQAVAAREHNVMVQATAGSGKSTVLVQSIHQIPVDERVIVLAFNKTIATEMGNKLAKAGLAHAEAKTLHSLGLAAYQAHAGCRPAINGRKVHELARQRITYADRDIRDTVVAMVGKAKTHGVVPRGMEGLKGLMPDTDETWTALAKRYDQDLGEGPARQKIVGLVRQLLAESIELANASIDFDDMLYMPLIEGARFPRYDRVLVDEVQDLSDIQINIIERLGGEHTKYILVGDVMQAIYAFRGADVHAMQRMKETLDCVELPLSITYRCAKAVVQEANKHDPRIEAAPNAPEGEVRVLTTEAMDFPDYKAGDMIICRFNAPLLRMAYGLLRRRVRIAVLGRDIGAGLAAVLKKVCKEGDTLSVMLDKVAKWENRELAKAAATEDDDKIQAITDKVGAIHAILEGTRFETLAEILEEINQLFTSEDIERKDLVTLASIHRSKGLEATTVYGLNYRLGFRAKNEDAAQQEVNLLLVQSTRAKLHFYPIYMGETIRRFQDIAKKSPRFVSPTLGVVVDELVALGDRRFATESPKP